jgi:hypothetical protein
LIFSDLALSRRLERAEGCASADFVEARAAAFPTRGAAWIEVGGALAMFDGVDSPITQTFALGLQGAVESADMDRLERFFTEREAPIHHEVSPLADPTAVRVLTTRRYEVIEYTSVMWRPIDPALRLSERGNPRISARLTRPDEGEVWATTAAAGWSHVPEIAPFLKELAAVHGRQRLSLQFIAETDARPIAAGALSVVDGVALLAGASTVPEARRQGAQLALLEARLRYAAEQGCDIAMMGAAPGSASQRNAERQGFRIAYTRTKWRKHRASDAT